MPNLKRLRKVAEAVELAPEERFDMSSWVKHQEGCGTAACACGWYAIATAPEFKWVFPKDRTCVLTSDLRMMDWDDWAEHFGIDDYDANYLFYASEYAPDDWDDDLVYRPTRAEVVNRIREFIGEVEAAQS